MVEPQHIDPMGEGMFSPNPRGGTLYNGSKMCTSCDGMLTPVQALSSDECSNCRRKRATKILNSRMVD